MTDRDDFQTPALRLGQPAPSDAAARAARQRELSLSATADSVFDEVARRAAEATGATAAMVNMVGENGQYLVGLYGKEPGSGEAAFLGDPGRYAAMDQGFCVHVVGRKAALTLDDVFDFSRFRGNPIVDELGVRSYIGVPLIDDGGTVIGTVCAIDPAPRSESDGNSWGNQGLQVLKAARDEVLAEISGRQKIAAILENAGGTAMIAARPGLEVLYANTLHDQLFGAVQVLGTPALEAFPHLAPVGILAVIETLDRGGEPTTTAPIPLSEPATGSVIFAAVPVRVPGHASAVLTLGLRDSDAATVLNRAAQIAADIGALSDTR
ncbi:putative GAF sensor protein [Catenulispora acidiphila DSM 44928]|uniref:Putative GAF sensor protein n=1 Tax=Catenulispora acidiphila (strain DSM 44928 / JCM 14897 / NBRC 102108 / NRRL B-24433 / ID139908) TaxID=479433 RepID=C7PVG4_CATAD|nr:GAF domain-containing protein [Catenulispora acidiphila]ACU69320.1 putative GAF sensor protein [Catenulispora acidiphila DSM 44928]